MVLGRWNTTVIATAVLLWTASAAAASGPPSASLALPSAVTPASAGLLLEAGVLVAQPAALATGQTLGAMLGVSSAGWLSWGVVTSLSQAAENSLSHAVDHLEWRSRALGRLVLQRGRGSLELSAAVGATLVSETRTRHQSGRLEGGLQAETALALLPAAEVMATVRLRVFEAWGLALSGGPSWHLETGDMRLNTGFSATAGVVRWL